MAACLRAAASVVAAAVRRAGATSRDGRLPALPPAPYAAARSKNLHNKAESGKAPRPRLLDNYTRAKGSRFSARRDVHVDPSLMDFVSSYIKVPSYWNNKLKTMPSEKKSYAAIVFFGASVHLTLYLRFDRITTELQLFQEQLRREFSDFRAKTNETIVELLKPDKKDSSEKDERSKEIDTSATRSPGKDERSKEIDTSATRSPEKDERSKEIDTSATRSPERIDLQKSSPSEKGIADTNEHTKQNPE